MESSSSKTESFTRLLQEHAKVLQATRAAIKKWEQFKYDYEVLQARLHTLPDRLTHDVMVPFGRFGFMQGQLYHTNEVMVLLGDNWFARRTAKQAIEIAERRRKDVCEMLDKEKEQLRDWEAREGFVQELSAATEGHRESFEIREEYDPVEEEKRKKAKMEERERRRGAVKVPPPRPAFPKAALSTDSAKTAGRKCERDKEEEEIWERLEQREKMELAGEDLSEAGSDIPKSTALITFKHSEAISTSPPEMDSGRGMIYYCPADIFQQNQEHALSGGGTSVGAEEEEGGGEVARKSVRWDPNLVSCSQQRQTEQGETTSASRPLSEAFSGQVIARDDPALPSQQSTARKMSKFKSSRNKPSA